MTNPLGIKCYQHSSGTWYYTLGDGNRIGYYLTWGMGCYRDDDNEPFRWRSDFERYLLKRLEQEMMPALEVICDTGRSGRTQGSE